MLSSIPVGQIESSHSETWQPKRHAMEANATRYTALKSVLTTFGGLEQEKSYVIEDRNELQL